MFRRLFLILSLLLIFFISCSDDDNPVSRQKITGSGDLITESRTVSPFHSINLITVGNIHLAQGATQSVSITVDDNVMDYIFTTVSNGVLTVSSDTGVNVTDFDLILNITMIDLEDLTLTGVGNIISANTFNADLVDIFLYGVGNIDLSLNVDRLTSIFSGVGNFNLLGSANRHLITHSAVGNMNAYSLVTDTTIAVLSGVGNAYVSVNDTLDATITGMGSLYYKGDPAVHQTITGQGRVIDAN
jgi:hypothetical protein